MLRPYKVRSAADTLSVPASLLVINSMKSLDKIFVSIFINNKRSENCSSSASDELVCLPEISNITNIKGECLGCFTT